MESQPSIWRDYTQNAARLQQFIVSTNFTRILILVEYIVPHASQLSGFSVDIQVMERSTEDGGGSEQLFGLQLGGTKYTRSVHQSPWAYITHTWFPPLNT